MQIDYNNNPNLQPRYRLPILHTIQFYLCKCETYPSAAPLKTLLTTRRTRLLGTVFNRRNVI